MKRYKIYLDSQTVLQLKQIKLRSWDDEEHFHFLSVNDWWDGKSFSLMLLVQDGVRIARQGSCFILWNTLAKSLIWGSRCDLHLERVAWLSTRVGLKRGAAAQPVLLQDSYPFLGLLELCKM